MEFHGSSGRISHLYLRGGKPQGIYDPRDHSGGLVWIALWRGQRLRRPSRRVDRLRLDPHRRPLDQHPARLWPFDDSRKQYRSDHRLGRRIARRGRHVHHSRADFSRLRLRVHLLADFPARAPGWMARRAAHGSATPSAHRQGARQSSLPRRHRMRRRARGRRAWRLLCQPRFLGTRPRRRLHRLHEHFSGLALAAGKPAQMVSRRFVPRQRHFRISRRRLHYRPARCRAALRWRHSLLARGDTRDQVFRPAFRPLRHLPRHDSHSGYVPRSTLGHLHSADGRGRRRRRGHHHVDSHLAHHYFRSAFWPQGCPCPKRRPILSLQPHRRGHAHAQCHLGLHRHHRDALGFADLPSHEGREHVFGVRIFLRPSSSSFSDFFLSLSRPVSAAFSATPPTPSAE